MTRTQGGAAKNGEGEEVVEQPPGEQSVRRFCRGEFGDIPSLRVGGAAPGGDDVPVDLGVKLHPQALPMRQAWPGGVAGAIISCVFLKHGV